MTPYLKGIVIKPFHLNGPFFLKKKTMRFYANNQCTQLFRLKGISDYNPSEMWNSTYPMKSMNSNYFESYERLRRKLRNLEMKLEQPNKNEKEDGRQTCAWVSVSEPGNKTRGCELYCNFIVDTHDTDSVHSPRIHLLYHFWQCHTRLACIWELASPKCSSWSHDQNERRHQHTEIRMCWISYRIPPWILPKTSKLQHI